MLEEQDRVLPAQARTEQADHVGGIEGTATIQPGEWTKCTSWVWLCHGSPARR